MIKVVFQSTILTVLYDNNGEDDVEEKMCDASLNC